MKKISSLKLSEEFISEYLKEEILLEGIGRKYRSLVSESNMLQLKCTLIIFSGVSAFFWHIRSCKKFGITRLLLLAGQGVFSLLVTSFFPRQINELLKFVTDKTKLFFVKFSENLSSLILSSIFFKVRLYFPPDLLLFVSSVIKHEWHKLDSPSFF